MEDNAEFQNANNGSNDNAYQNVQNNLTDEEAKFLNSNGIQANAGKSLSHDKCFRTIVYGDRGSCDDVRIAYGLIWLYMNYKFFIYSDVWYSKQQIKPEDKSGEDTYVANLIRLMVPLRDKIDQDKRERALKYEDKYIPDFNIKKVNNFKYKLYFGTGDWRQHVKTKIERLPPELPDYPQDDISDIEGGGSSNCEDCSAMKSFLSIIIDFVYDNYNNIDKFIRSFFKTAGFIANINKEIYKYIKKYLEGSIYRAVPTVNYAIGTAIAGDRISPLIAKKNVLVLQALSSIYDGHDIYYSTTKASDKCGNLTQPYRLDENLLKTVKIFINTILKEKTLTPFLPFEKRKEFLIKTLDYYQNFEEKTICNIGEFLHLYQSFGAVLYGYRVPSGDGIKETYYKVIDKLYIDIIYKYISSRDIIVVPENPFTSYIVNRLNTLTIQKLEGFIRMLRNIDMNPINITYLEQTWLSMSGNFIEEYPVNKKIQAAVLFLSSNTFQEGYLVLEHARDYPHMVFDRRSSSSSSYSSSLDETIGYS